VSSIILLLWICCWNANSEKMVKVDTVYIYGSDRKMKSGVLFFNHLVHSQMLWVADGLNMLEAQIAGSEAMSNAEMIDCDGNIGALVSPVVEVPLSLLEHWHSSRLSSFNSGQFLIDMYAVSPGLSKGVWVERGKVFPGSATFGSPAIARNIYIYMLMFDSRTDHPNWAYISRQLFCDNFSVNERMYSVF